MRTNDGAKSRFGNAGIDRADGLGGDDLVNGGTDDDELYGQASRSRTRLGAGTVIVRPKTSRKGRRLLSRRTKVTMTLAVDVTDDQGRTTTLAQVLRFRP